MKFLISITSYFDNKTVYINQILEQYDAIQSRLNVQIDVVLSCNYEFVHSKRRNINVILNNDAQHVGEVHAWSNFDYIVANHKNYDYIIESDDDILITEDNIQQYIKLQNICDDYIPGFIVYEMDQDQVVYPQSMHLKYPPFVEQQLTFADQQYFVPKNVHSACYMIDQKRLSVLIDQNKFSKDRYTLGVYDVQCTARSLVYINGYTKVVSVNDIKKHLVHHLPNRYLSLNNDWFPRSGYKPLNYWMQTLFNHC